MANTLTYSSLITNTLKYLQRQDDTVLAAILPFCIELAIDRITKDADILGGVTYVTGNFTPNNPVLQKPTLWRDTMSMYVGTGENFQERQSIILRSYDDLVNYWPNDTLTGTPLFFANYDFNTWKIAPTPDQAYPFEISFFQEYGPLNDEQQTNWLTQFAPQVIFYATLLEALIFLQYDERYASLEDKYNKAVASLIAQDKKRITDRYTQRDKD